MIRAKGHKLSDEKLQLILENEKEWRKYMIDRLLISLFTGGHVLLEGVPGLAKTETVKTLAKAVDVKYQRLQFTPDLLPADLIGTMIYNQNENKFEILSQVF